jgi:alkylation response protein AidB-like acyl-CoA dehydrogenase
MHSPRFTTLLQSVSGQPDAAALDDFYREIRQTPELYRACESMPARELHRASLATIHDLGRSNVPIALGLAMHVYMCGAIASFPIAATSPLGVFRGTFLQQLNDQRLLLANMASNRDLGAGDVPVSPQPQSDGYVITGRRSFMSLAHRADVLLLVVEIAGRHNIFLVPLQGNPAIRFGPSPVVGTMDLSETVSVELDGLEVQPLPSFGEASAGRMTEMLAFQRIWFQSLVPAAYLGGARRALEELVHVSRERRSPQGGVLCESEAFLAQLGELRIRLDSAYDLLDGCGESIDALLREQQPIVRVYDRTVVAKLHATRTAREVVAEICALVGTASMRPDSVLERIHREVAFADFHPMSRFEGQQRLARRCLEEIE